MQKRLWSDWSEFDIMPNGKIIFSEQQRSFLLSNTAQSLKPKEAAELKGYEAYERLRDVRFGWSGGKPECPDCGASSPYELSKGLRLGVYRCRKCGSNFSLTSKTPFANHKIDYKTILRSIASRIHEPSNFLSKATGATLGVNYKTVWAWQQKFRLFLGNIDRIRPRDNYWPYIQTNSDRDGHALVKLINGVMPKTIPEQVRADVAQDMILAVLSGETTEEDLARYVSRYIRRHYKNVETPYLAVSLNQPVPGTDGMSWNDILPNDCVRA